MPFKARAGAQLSKTGIMSVTKGAFIYTGSNEKLLEGFKATNQMTLVTRIAANNLTQFGPARIISFSLDSGNANFTLGQDKTKLVLRLRTSKKKGVGTEVPIAIVPTNGKAITLALTYRPGELTVYINGKRTGQITSIQGDFSNWELYHLILGDEYKAARDWDGNIGSLHLYNRVLSAKEIARLGKR